VRLSERWIRTPAGFHFSLHVARIVAALSGLPLAMFQDHQR